MTVDLFGCCADYERILPLCERYDVSFNGNKIMTTPAGGMLLTGDAAMADRARHLASQARLPAEHYEHAEIGLILPSGSARCENEVRRVLDDVMEFLDGHR